MNLLDKLYDLGKLEKWIECDGIMNTYFYSHKGFDSDACYTVLAKAENEKDAFDIIGERVGSSVKRNMKIDDIQVLKFDDDNTFVIDWIWIKQQF